MSQNKKYYTLSTHKTLYFLWVTTILFSATVFSSYAQISEGGTPPSFMYPASQKTRSLQNKKNGIKNIYIPFSLDDLKADDERMKEEFLPPRVAVLLPASFSPENSGVWSTLPGGERIWQLRIMANKAKAISLYYKKFNLPIGSKLFIYNSAHTHILGAYTHKTHPGKGKFATEFVAGDDIILEYVAPKSDEFPQNPEIEIEEIGYGYNYLSIKDSYSESLSGSCMVDINCEEGEQWQDHKNGVVKMIIPIGTSSFLCTGSILNNTKEDLKPYLLTAFHCLLSSKEQASASDLSQAQFFFRYENTTCGSNTPTSPVSMIGCTYIAGVPLENGVDGALLLLNGKIPDNLNAYYNGWDRRNIAPQSGVCIHHPQGDVKKISTYDQPAVSDTWKSGSTQGLQDGHWNVIFKSTANGHGVTEGGSSGAPLFDQNKRITGFLTGGNANCTDRKEGRNLFGKLALFWDQCGTADDQRIDKYLDPIGSGVEYLDGRYAFPPKAVPEQVSAKWSSEEKRSIVNWEAPKGDEQPVRYKIYRNSTEIGTTTSTSFSETALPVGIHHYDVTAIYADNKASDPGNTATIYVYDILPPKNISIKRTDETELQIEWQMPISRQKIFWGNATDFYRMQLRDKDNQQIPFYFGQRWTTDDLQEIDGYTLESVTFLSVEGATYSLHIDQGNFSYQQKIDPTDKDQIIEVKLLKPVTIKKDAALTVSIYAESYTNSPAATDNAVPITQKGNIYSTDGQNWKTLTQHSDKDHNFFLQVGISSLKQSNVVPPQQEIKKRSVKNKNSDENSQIQWQTVPRPALLQKTNTKTCSSIPIRFNRPDFRIYRDGTNITPELTTDTIITDKELSQGNNYTYTIEAIYPDGVNALSDPETFFLKTESFEARIRSLKINGEDVEISQENTLNIPLDCDINSARIEIEAHPGATIIMGDQISGTAEINVEGGGKFNQPVTIISESKENTQEFSVNLFKLPNNILLLRWNDVLSVINNPENNNGLHFTDFVWYRNNHYLSSGIPYIKLPDDHQSSDKYHILVTTDEGVSLSSCEKQIQITGDEIRLYPNPIKAGEKIKLYIDSQKENNKVEITITDLSGKTKTFSAIGNSVKFTLSDTPGSYIVKITTQEGISREIKVICIP